jgi:hypothetical protein
MYLHTNPDINIHHHHGQSEIFVSSLVFSPSLLYCIHTVRLVPEFDYDNANAVKVALKKGVSSGVLVQSGQSFVVKDDPVRLHQPEAGDEEQLQIINVQQSKSKS